MSCRQKKMWMWIGHKTADTTPVFFIRWGVGVVTSAFMAEVK